MKKSDFYFELPEELIAQTPLEKRDSSRLLHLDKVTGEMEHRHFYELLDYLHEGDCMVFNDSTRRVMQKLGQTPILYETGVFSVAVKNKNAARMKAFAVDLNGRRQGEIPVTAKDGVLYLRADTAKLPGGPALFFEIAEK